MSGLICLNLCRDLRYCICKERLPQFNIIPFVIHMSFLKNIPAFMSYHQLTRTTQPVTNITFNNAFSPRPFYVRERQWGTSDTNSTVFPVQRTLFTTNQLKFIWLITSAPISRTFITTEVKNFLIPQLYILSQRKRQRKRKQIRLRRLPSSWSLRKRGKTCKSKSNQYPDLKVGFDVVLVSLTSYMQWLNYIVFPDQSLAILSGVCLIWIITIDNAWN